MANRHDLLIRLDSEFSDKGFRSAEQSAKTLERELNKQESAERGLASMQMAAHREQARRDAARVASMAAVGRGMVGIGLAAAVGLGVAGKAAMDWETAWAGVTKTVDGSASELAALEGQLRNLAKTLPATHEEIAGVAEAAGQLGVKRQDVAGFTKTMIDLGVSTNLSSEEAATGIAQISNVMGTLSREGTAGVSKFGATLVALGNAGASTERDILDMAQRLSGAAKLIGASESDVLALSNAMASLGIEAELGGGAMSRTMLKINSAVIEGGDALNDFAEVSGMSATAFASKWQSDPVAAIDLFVKGLARVNDSGGDAAKTLGDLGLKGTQNAQVLLRMTGAGDLLTESLDLGNRAWGENTALVDEANKRYETAASRVAIARNQLNDAAIDIGANVLPAFAGAADRVGFLAESFGSLPGPVKQAVTVLGGLVMTFGLLGGGALILIPKLVAMNATLAASGPAGAAAARGLSAAGSAMMGPWGLALAGATLALGVFAEKNYEAKARADELTATLDEQTGAITDNSRQWSISEMSNGGTLKAAKELGLNLESVTDAALGNTFAAEALNEQMDGMLARQRELVTTGEANMGTYDALYRSVSNVRGAIGGQNSTLEDAKTQWDLTREATGAAADATDGATGAAGEFSTAQADAATETANAAKELDELISSVENYGDTVNSALDATSAYEAALDAANEALDTNGKTANKARTAINLHTEAGRSNDKALRDVATSALKSAAANFENGASVQSVTKAVGRARTSFVDMATKMGLSKTAANRLADQLGLTKGNVTSLSGAIEAVPKSHNTTITVQTAAAKAAVDAMQRKLNSLQGKDVRINVRYNVGARPNGGRDLTGGLSSAQGNLIEYSGRFAGGGYAPPIGPIQPQIRTAGGAGLTWAEHGAGPWEAYISGNPAKHDRSMAIWEDTGRRLGAFESVRSQPAVTVEGSKSLDRSIHVTAYGHDAAAVAKQIRRQQAQEAALHPEFGD